MQLIKTNKSPIRVKKRRKIEVTNAVSYIIRWFRKVFLWRASIFNIQVPKLLTVGTL